MGACALILLVVPATAQSQSNADLSAQLTRHLSTMKKDQQVLRFLDKHRWLLSDPRFEAGAKRQLRLHILSLAHTKKMAAQAKRALAAQAKVQAKVRHLAAVEAAKPENVICRVFGPHCGEALAVSRCESGLSTSAQNGQYLGLFQMGSNERLLFGHGPSALEQAKAAYRYFVASGRGWSPWSCKPWS
jgi:hypothetical protein